MTGAEVLSREYMAAIVVAIIMGTLARAMTLVVDYRQTPSYPDGKYIQLFAGFVAAALGAVALPALLEKNYAAFTFLAMGVQHFRDIRKIEMESLTSLEGTGFARRGGAYIDGIAKTYEAKNYTSLVVSLVVVAVMLGLNHPSRPLNVAAGVLAGFVAAQALKRLTKGKVVGDYCKVTPVEARVEGTELYAGDMFVSNMLGTATGQGFVAKEALAVIIEPKEGDNLFLHNPGQRQAMLYEAASSLGCRRYQFTRRSFTENRVAIVLVPVLRDRERFVAAVRNTPVLENSRKVEKIKKGV